MTYNKDKFTQVMMCNEDYEVYCDWIREIHNTFKSKTHKGFLSLALNNGRYCLEDLKELQSDNTHTKYGMSYVVGFPIKQIIKKINDKYNFENLEDKSQFRMKHTELVNLIIKQYSLKKGDSRTVNPRKQEVYEILDLKQIQEGKTYWVVHRSYFKEESINSKVYDEFSIENITDKFIDRIISKGSTGISKPVLLQDLRVYDEKYGVNLNKLKAMLFRKIKLNGEIKEIKVDDIERFAIVTKQDEADEIDKELDDVFGGLM